MSSLSPLLLYLSLSLALGVTDDQQYCAVRYRRLCQGKGHHVGCQYPESGPGPACQKYKQITFDNDFKYFILHYINRRRQRIAAGLERVRGGAHVPKPEVMMLVEWDRELAMLAQRLADQCTFMHDECRAIVRYPYAGQTVGEVRWRRLSESDALSARRAIRRVFDAWWGERRRVTPQQLTAPFRLSPKGAVWGHFSQLAVWTLRAVGCGAVRHGTTSPRLLLVCDFSHTNMLGQSTLLPGPEAPCPLHTARRPRSPYHLLCAPVHRLTQTETYEEDSDTDDMADVPNEEITKADVEPIDNVTSHAKLDKLTRVWEVTQDTMRRVEDTSQDYYLPHLKHRTFKNKMPHEWEGRRKGGIKNFNARGRTNSLVADLPEENRKVSSLKWRQKADQEDSFLVAHTKNTKRVFTKSEDVEFVERKRPAVTYSLPTVLGRRKWQRTRIRPQRPGASALLNVAVTDHRTSLRPRPSIASLMLDKEDREQLFKDTGFNPDWASVNGN